MIKTKLIQAAGEYLEALKHNMSGFANVVLAGGVACEDLAAGGLLWVIDEDNLDVTGLQVEDFVSGDEASFLGGPTFALGVSCKEQNHE